MVCLNFLNAVLALSAITVVIAGPDTNNWGKACRMDYDGGMNWADVGNVRYHLERACKGYPGGRGAFQDVYFKPWNESPFTAKVCVDQSYTNSHINIEIGNLNPNNGYTLNPNDCNKELQALTTGLRGGEAQNYGWFFRVDPNAGSC